MAADLNGVKTEVLRRGYHHGDLRAALLAAAAEIIEEAGLDAFSLRASARRAGVSAAAPSHHFGDTRGLLTALAVMGFVELGEALETAKGVDRRAVIRAQSLAYLRFAEKRPGLFRLMWRKNILDVDDPNYVAAARRAFLVLDAAVRGKGTALASASSMLELAPAIACWSMVHGFVAMAIDGAFFAQDPGETHELLEAMLKRLDLP